MARALGRRGGRARARRLSAAERKAIAALGGVARRESFLAAARLTDNLRYVAAIRELAPPPRVERVSVCRGPLPGHHVRP